MQSEQVIGAVGISQMVVRPGDTALAHGSGDMPVLSSSFLLTLMESACNSSIAEFLDNADVSNLHRFALSIHDSVGIGAELQASVTCVDLSDGLLRFECEVYEGHRLIASAVMERLVVERMSFLARIAAQALISQHGVE